MISFFIESVIHWQGIDAQGHQIKHVFIGRRRAFKAFYKKEGIVLLSTQYAYHVKRKHNNTQLVNLFTKELAHALATGLPLISALSLLQKKQHQSPIEALLGDIQKNITSGKSLSESLQYHPSIFSESMIQLICAAEKAHQLPTLLKQLSQQQQTTEQLTRQFKKAMIYPLSVLFFTMIITLGLVTFVIPQFQSLFNNFNAPLPDATQFLIAMTFYIKKHHVALTLCSITLPMIVLYGYHASHYMKRSIQNALLQLPLLGNLYRLKLLATWTSVLALTLKSGVRLQEGLTLANNTLTHIALQASCEQLQQKMNSGYKLHQALAHTPLFEPAECYLIEIGEATTTLPLLLERLSQESLTFIEYTLDTLSQWIEPAIMVLLALVAGGLIITMYLPIFKIGTLL